MAHDSASDYCFENIPEVKATFGNRRNWRRFCALANAMAVELALHRWGVMPTLFPA